MNVGVEQQVPTEIHALNASSTGFHSEMKNEVSK
jgi:hypothetical protein